MTPWDTFADCRLAMTGPETCNSSISLQNTSLTVFSSDCWMSEYSQLASLPTTSTQVDPPLHLNVDREYKRGGDVHDFAF